MTEQPYIALVERAQRGDQTAFDDLVLAFQDLAVGTAFGWLGEIELARDATQEAFLEAHLQLSQLREPAAFPAWLRKLVIKHCDRVTRRRQLSLTSIEHAADLVAPALDVSAERLTAERAAWLRLAVAGLPPGERLVVALHYFAEVPGPALAAFLELPLSTIKKRLRRARARLRDDGDQLMQKTIDTMRPSRSGEFADEVRFFVALRASDLQAVRQMLACAPELVNAQQQWAPSLVYDGVLPFASRATALLTAIERDDLAMMSLLLDAGADVDGVCGCVTGESPLWAAALLGRIELLRELLRRGAAPNVVAASGNTPLHVAAIRGHLDIARELLAQGARPDALDRHGRTALDWAQANGHEALVACLGPSVAAAWGGPSDHGVRTSDEPLFRSGIKALDLFVPIPRGGLVRFPFVAGIGMLVLLGELSKRIAARKHGHALWAGVTPRPFDLRDWQAEVAELGLAENVQQHLVGFEADAEQRRDAFAAALDHAEALRDAGGDVLLVVFCETGFEADVDASLVRLARSRGPGCITSIVVTPFLETQPNWTTLAPPFKAQIVLDRRRAKKRLFPAIDPLASLSEPLLTGSVGARHVEIALRARQLLERYAAIDPEFELWAKSADEPTDPDVRRAHRLLGYLRQSFVVAEPFSGQPGHWVTEEQLLDEVEATLAL